MTSSATGAIRGSRSRQDFWLREKVDGTLDEFRYGGRFVVAEVVKTFGCVRRRNGTLDEFRYGGREEDGTLDEFRYGGREEDGTLDEFRYESVANLQRRMSF